MGPSSVTDPVMLVTSVTSRQTVASRGCMVVGVLGIEDVGVRAGEARGVRGGVSCGKIKWRRKTICPSSQLRPLKSYPRPFNRPWSPIPSRSFSEILSNFFSTINARKSHKDSYDFISIFDGPYDNFKAPEAPIIQRLARWLSSSVSYYTF